MVEILLIEFEDCLDLDVGVNINVSLVREGDLNACD